MGIINFRNYIIAVISDKGNYSLSLLGLIHQIFITAEGSNTFHHDNLKSHNIFKENNARDFE